MEDEKTKFKVLSSIWKKKILCCEKCLFESTSREQLAKHKKTTHEGEMFPCPYCQFRTKCRSTLNRHIKSIHEQ